MPMNDLDVFFRLVTEHEPEAYFVGPRAELVAAAERALGLRLPPSYSRFVSRLGAGDIAGQEFFGLVQSDFANSGIPDMVWLTLRAREEWGLPASMLVVYFEGSTRYYVLDTAKADSSGEPPVEAWTPGVSTASDGLPQVFDDFGSMARALAEEGLGLR
jgi:hypothetical protein